MRYLTLLRRPVPLLLWLGQVASLAGDRLYAMAVLWLTLSLTGSTTATATVALTTALPQAVIGLVGTGLVDRVQRFRLMVRLDLIRGLLLVLLPILFYLGQLKPWYLGALGLVMGSLDALFQPALQATLPQAVSAEEFPGFAGLMDTPNRFARLLGPGLAGILLTFISPIHFFTIDGATFFASALALTLAGRRMGATVSRSASTKLTDIRFELKEGVRQLGANRDLLRIFCGDGVGNVAFAAFNLAGLLLMTQRLHSDVGGFGLLIGAYGLGSLVGNFAAGNLGGRLPYAIVAQGGWIGVGIGFVAIGSAANLPWAIAAAAFSGAFGSLMHVSRAVYLRQAVPGEHLGKVYSLLNLTTQLTFAIGTMLVGLLLERMPAAYVMGGAGILMAISSAIIVVSRRGRRAPLAA